MIEQTTKQDEKAMKLLANLPANPFQYRLRQDNEQEMRERFERTEELPVFSYKHAQKLNVGAYIKDLNTVKGEINDLELKPVVKNWYLKKIDQLYLRAKTIEAVQEKDDVAVTRLSKQMYGDAPFTLDDLQQEFEQRLSMAKNAFLHSHPVDAKMFRAMIQKTMDHYEITNWDIEITSIDSIRIKHGKHGSRPRILIPANLRISKARAARLLAHEIEVHVLRTHNGLQSPIHLLGRGLDAYAQTDEGLAMHYQLELMPNKSGLMPGFWDAWGTLLALETDFKTTYDTIFEARKALAEAAGRDDAEKRAKDAAWKLCLRVYRGITDTSNAGTAYARGHVYRAGLLQIRELIQEHGTDMLSLLFAGNIGHEHIDDLKALAIPPGRTPDLIGKEVVRSFFEE